MVVKWQPFWAFGSSQQNPSAKSQDALPVSKPSLHLHNEITCLQQEPFQSWTTLLEALKGNNNSMFQVGPVASGRAVHHGVGLHAAVAAKLAHSVVM